MSGRDARQTRFFFVIQDWSPLEEREHDDRDTPKEAKGRTLELLRWTLAIYCKQIVLMTRVQALHALDGQKLLWLFQTFSIAKFKAE